MNGTDPLASLGYEAQLKRSLSLLDLLAYGLVFIIPIAPVAVFGIVFNASHGMVPLVYAIGLVAMLFTAWSYTAMCRAYPVAGSVYSYASKAFGPAVGFFSGWAMLLDYFLLPTLIYIGCAIAVHAALPAISKPLCVIMMFITATAINSFEIKITARASFVLLAFQLLILLLFAICATHALLHHEAGSRLSLAPFYNPSEFTPALMFSALSLAVLSFLGFDAISTLSEESKAGATPVARAIVLSLCVSALLFIAQTWLGSLFVLDRTSFPPGDSTHAAFYDIAGGVGGYWLKFLLAVPGIFFSGLAGAVTAQAAAGRLLFGMARDGGLPRALAHVDPHRQVPQRALWLVASITLLLALALLEQFELLVSMVSFGALLGFLLLHLSVIAVFIARQRSRRWLRHLVAPSIGFAVIAYVIVNADRHAKVAGVAWLAAGLALFACLKWMKRRQPAATAVLQRDEE